MSAKPPAATTRTVTVDGNKLTLLPDGPDRLDAIIEMIDSARTSLRLLYYIYASDKSGAKVRDALQRAVKRGVRLDMLLDDFGSSKLPANYFAELVEAGASICRFHPAWGRRYLLRNHQKLLLVDGEGKKPRGLIGGFNIENDYFKPVDGGGWRDIGLTIDGPAAARLAPYYDELLVWARKPNARIRALREIILKHSEHRGPLQWQYGGPMRRLSPWAVATCRDLAKGKDVEMIAAYFAPTRGMLRRIGRIGHDGRARLIMAAKSDNDATIAAARFTYKKLLKRGVEIYEYRPTKLHTKLLVLDDIVHIGSSNFDIRSLYLNMEMMLRVADAEFASLMRIYFLGELEDCIEVTPELHAKRATWLNRAKWALSFFLVTSADYTVTRRLNFGVE